jgi:DNA-binding MarR family transcriptional regulator
MIGSQKVINIESYIPHFFSTINNSLSWGASNLYREKFGVGIVDWRVISMLAIEPDITAFRICEVLSIDKAAVSRSLKFLQSQGHLQYESAPTDPRKRTWKLSPSGYALHDAIIEIALERERRLVSGIDQVDIRIFLKVVRQIRDNLKSLPDTTA